jgi:DMSO/TMAO reductase YedYZ molybdopterin-dependent catalytic subunit
MTHTLAARSTVVALALSTALLAGCALPGKSTTDATTGKPIDLGAVEVKSYKGERLDSAADFRENSIKGPQKVDKARYRMRVVGNGGDPPLTLTYAQVIERSPFKKVVRLTCVEGWSVDILWEGVRIADLLEQAGYDKSGKTVIFRCADGYSTSLPLDFVLGRDLLLAYKMNGIDLPTERGFPFQVVAEDRYGYKWAKWVTSIEVTRATDFRGYWESRGYDNGAKLPAGK